MLCIAQYQVKCWEDPCPGMPHTPGKPEKGVMNPMRQLIPVGAQAVEGSMLCAARGGQ